MLLFTLIAREMRSAARQPFTYYLRMLSVAALLVVLVFAVVQGGGETGRGGHVFAQLHATLFGSIWILVPLLTADCISRERREGTLPILFLTPLKPRQIVLAKGLAHGLRALTLWLAVLPVMAIPFLIGGVSWLEAVFSLLLTFSSIGLAMAAGLLASANAHLAVRALVLATCLALGFFFCFATELSFLNAGGGIRLPFAYGMPTAQADILSLFGFGLQLALDIGACWQNLLGATLQPWLVSSGYVNPKAPLGTNWPLLINGAILFASCLLVLVFLIQLAALNLNRMWREEPPSERVVRIRKRLLTPIYFQRLLGSWMRWELNHNPIGWLEQRTWSARLVTWSWFAVFMCIYSSLLANLWLYQNSFHRIQVLLGCLLSASIAVSAARSFHRERENGVLELLLVSPLHESQIIAGRIRGLLTQFMPAIVLFVALWGFFATFLSPDHSELASILYCCSTLVSLAVIGLYQSLARTSFMVALLSTVFLGAAVPGMIAQIGNLLDFATWALGGPSVSFVADRSASIVAIVVQCLLAVACLWRLHRNLTLRRFALDRPIT